MCLSNDANTVCGIPASSIKARPKKSGIPWCLETKATILWCLHHYNILPENASRPEFSSEFLPFVRKLCNIRHFGGDFDAYAIPKFDTMATDCAARWVRKLGLVHDRGGVETWDLDIVKTWFKDTKGVAAWLHIQGKPDHQGNSPLGTFPQTTPSTSSNRSLSPASVLSKSGGGSTASSSLAGSASLIQRLEVKDVHKRLFEPAPGLFLDALDMGPSFNPWSSNQSIDNDRLVQVTTATPVFGAAALALQRPAEAPPKSEVQYSTAAARGPPTTTQDLSTPLWPGLPSNGRHPAIRSAVSSSPSSSSLLSPSTRQTPRWPTPQQPSVAGSVASVTSSASTGLMAKKEHREPQELGYNYQYAADLLEKQRQSVQVVIDIEFHLRALHMR